MDFLQWSEENQGSTDHGAMVFLIIPVHQRMGTSWYAGESAYPSAWPLALWP